MLNIIWASLIVIGFFVGALNGKLDLVTNAAIDSAKGGVELAIGLIGIMALWLGIMRIGEDSGLIKALGRLLRPIMKSLFPDIPADHPAMGAMIMNISANILGLGNAATPFGIKAMEELQTLNHKKDTATNAMITFLAINTSSVTLIPSSTIAILSSLGATNPTNIIGPTIIATAISTSVAIIASKILQNSPKYRSKSTRFGGRVNCSSK